MIQVTWPRLLSDILRKDLGAVALHYAEELPLSAMGVVGKTLRGGLGLVLSFWIAGAGCMFGCENMLRSVATHHDATGQQDLATIVSGEACAPSGSHDCCAKKKAEAIKVKAPAASARPALQTAAQTSQAESVNADPSGSMTECPLALSRAVAATKTSGSKQVGAPVALSLKALLVESSNERQTSLFPKASLPNRGHTYIRCCVFLI